MACGEDVEDSNRSHIVADGDSEPDSDSDGDPDGDSEPVGDGDSEPPGDSEPDPDGDTEPPGDGEPDGDSEPTLNDLGPSWIGGHSVEDRPIVIEHYGDSGPVLFILSAIHGSERLAVTYGERFRTELNTGYAERHGIQVVYMQATNPDGIAIYERFNVNDVDLNRNFPTANFEPGGVGGDTPLSEPEAVAIKEAVDASNLTAVLSVHCCVPLFDHDGPGEELAQAMSDAMDPAYSFPEGKLGASPGSLGSYVGLELGLPIITVEFARAEHTDPLIQLAQMDYAFDAAGLWTMENPGPTDIDFDAMPHENDWNYHAWFTGESAAGIPLRAESMGESQGGQSDDNYILLSGLGGDGYLGPWIAEHIRRELLAIPWLDAPSWQMITAVNPDGMATGSALNEADVDIRAAIATEDSSSDEAAAVLELLADSPATVFLVESSDDSVDRVSIVGPRTQELTEHIAPRFSASVDPADMELAEALASRGHTVVQIVVGSENAEAQTQDFGLDDSLNSPFDFSEMVFDMSL